MIDLTFYPKSLNIIALFGFMSSEISDAVTFESSSFVFHFSTEFFPSAKVEIHAKSTKNIRHVIDHFRNGHIAT